MNDSTDLTWATATELADLYRRRAASPVEVVQAVLTQLEAWEPTINAFVTVTAEQAITEAHRAQEQLAGNRDPATLPPLFGIPVTVKDLIDTAGVRTTYGSTIHADHVPTADGTDWQRLREAGAILIGKTTTPEFGLLGVTESRLTGVTNNPWNPSMTAGGSSGGAAASVAAGIAPIAWGSDGGGSIRIPAACCGVVGLKPSEGRIPSTPAAGCQGVTTSGPLTRSVVDAALALSITAGPTGTDIHSLPMPDRREFLDAVRNPTLAGLRIATAPHLGLGPVSDEVSTVVDDAVLLMTELGARTAAVDMHLPDPIDYFLGFWSPAFTAALAELRTLDGWTDDRLHPMMLRIAERGAAMTAIEYWNTSVNTRQTIVSAFAEVFERFDLLVLPTMPLTAFAHPGDVGGNTDIDGVPVREPAIDFHRLTEPASHAGLPSLTVPCGFDAIGMPVGLQIIGPQHADAAVLAAGAAYEAAARWNAHHPQLP